MELYSYDYALKALWLYTSEPEWASNWSNCERQPRSTPIMTLVHMEGVDCRRRDTGRRVRQESGKIRTELAA